MSSPAFAAASEVRPTLATSGSLNVTCGTAAWSAVATWVPHGASSTGEPFARAAITSPHARAWYLPWWVSSARWFTSPVAYSQSKPSTSRVSSTVSQSPGVRPIVSSPMSVLRGVRPVAISTCSARIASPSMRIETPSSVRSTRSGSALTMVTPRSRNPCATMSPAKSSWPRRMPLRAMIVTAVPNVAYAVAISTATTPPPMIARLFGATCADVASRGVHGVTESSPGIDGMSGSEPVLTTTACRAVSSVTAPSSAVTLTRFCPVILPWPRSNPMPVSRTQFTCDSSSQSCTNSLRRAKTPATSSSPVTAALAPLTRWAARSACPLRSSALDGMQAQYEHSPPTSSLSTSSAVKPPCTARSATFSATAPPPMTMTSYSVAPVVPLICSELTVPS
jgi:hypothetical protein